MRVRVWIGGADGPSHDFELGDTPRTGERISISVGGRIEEGIVTSVTWHLLGIERSDGALALEGEPVGAVSLVHVVCSPTAEVVKLNYERASVDAAAQGATMDR